MKYHCINTDKLLKKEACISRPVCFLIAGALVVFLGCSENKITYSYKKNIDQSVTWLLSQQVPNATIALPLPIRRHLIAGYKVPASDPSFPFLSNKSFSYDNAIASIALCYNGKWDEARLMLTALARIVRADGSLWFSYNLQVEWPSETDQDMALVRTGALAWVGYAFCFFLENCPPSKLDGPSQILCVQAAQAIATHIQKKIIRDATSPLYGLARGGFGEIGHALSSDKKEFVETFSPSVITWVSTEHNIDTHLFLRHLYGLTKDKQLKIDANLIAEQLLSRLWSTTHRQFFRGLQQDGSVDSVLALDCAAWGSLFLRTIGQDSLATLCAQAIVPRYANQVNGIPGFLPYYGCRIHESYTMNTFYYPDNPQKMWGAFPFTWWEGSFSVVTALLTTGTTNSEARDMLRVWAGYFNSQDHFSGGIPYSSTNIPFQFTLWESCAATAWYSIALSLTTGKKLPHPFFS